VFQKAKKVLKDFCFDL